MTIKDLKDVKIDNVNPLFLIFSKVNRYFEEINKNKYLMLVPTNKKNTKNKKKYEKLWNKIRDLIRSMTENSVDYDKRYMPIKFNSDCELPLIKTMEITSMIIVARVAFYEK